MSKKEHTMATYPNQKTIRIHKQSIDGDYLLIDNSSWMKAYNHLKKRNTFGLYLYLAKNADGYNLDLSRRHVMDALGMSKDSYIRAVKELEDVGYLVKDVDGFYDFYLEIDTVEEV